MVCIESDLFGQAHCRWCGEEIKKPYTSIESRLCSDSCSENYWAHVMGDRTAALGTGTRYLAWLQKNHPREYREAAGIKPASEGFCGNPYCTRGESGQPASLSHLRAGTRFCSDACKKQLRRAA
jgi:predicted nucleic acid-binding Zn ribbon protein